MTLRFKFCVALALYGSLGSGCSLVLDAETTQCSVDSDCDLLGSGYRCEAEVCVQTLDEGMTTGAPMTTTGELPTGTAGSSSTSASEASTSSTTASEESSESTGGPSVCPPVSQYQWSDSIAVVRNACELPSQVGSVMTRGDNEVEVMAPLEELPFDICLYGVLAEQLWIGDNGYVTLGASAPGALQSDVGVPHSLGEAGVPAPGVVPFWDSMQPSSSGVCVAIEGNEPNRTLWITWAGSCFEDGTNTCNGESGSSLTFSVGFEESSGTILVGYLSMTGEGGLEERANGQTSTTGITNVGPRNCPASQCSDDGLCEDGSPCNYTEVASSEIRNLDTIQFEAIR